MRWRRLPPTAEHPGIIVLLQPTSPLRRPEHIVDAVEMLKQTPATSVVSVVEVPRHLSPDYVMRVEAGVLKPFLADGLRITRRQDARQAYVRDGTVYAFRPKRSIGFDIYEDCRPLSDLTNTCDHSPADWDVAERMLAAQRAASGGLPQARGGSGASGKAMKQVSLILGLLSWS